MLAYDLLLEKIAAYQSDKTDELLRQHLANEIVKANEGLCVLKAQKFRDSGVEWDVLLNAARQGIAKTIEKFDPDKGYKFSTYACYWIKKYLQLAVDNNRLIYLPDSAQRVARKAQKMIDDGDSDVFRISEALGKETDYVWDCIGMSRDVQRIPVNDDGKEMDFASPVDEEPEASPIQIALAKLPPSITNRKKAARAPYGLPKDFVASRKQSFHQESTLINHSATNATDVTASSSEEFKQINLQLVQQYQSLPDGSRKNRLANQILRFNSGLCRTKASNYTCPTLTHEDFLVCAQLGVFVAADRFDTAKSGNFATYACQWIRKFCNYAVTNNRIIHVPDSAQRLAKKVAKCLEQGMNTIEAIAVHLNKKDVSYVSDAFEGASRFCSQMPIREDGTEIDFVDPNTVEDSIAGEDESHLTGIRQALSSLDSQVAEICLLIADGMAPKDVAQQMGLSTRQINEIYEDSIAQLKAELVKPDTETVTDPPEQPQPVRGWSSIKARILNALGSLPSAITTRVNTLLRRNDKPIVLERSSLNDLSHQSSVDHATDAQIVSLAKLIHHSKGICRNESQDQSARGRPRRTSTQNTS